MKKNIVIAILIILVILVAGFFKFKWMLAKNEVADYKNATYQIDTSSITLVNGRAENETAPGSASKSITQYFGNGVEADFNGDGTNDVAFLLTQDSGGSGTFYYVALALKTASGGYRGVNSIFLGDRIAPQTTEFKDGAIIVNFAAHKAGEAMTARPSVGVSKYFRVQNNQLIEVKK